MDFFGSQDTRKQQSLALLMCFIAAMLAMAAIIHIVVVVVTIPVVSEINFFAPTTQAKAFIAIIWLTCCAGCFFRILDVRAGGATLARRFGAVEATADGRYRDEKLLIDIVSEMSVASACAMPRVFLLHREESINAFVVGGFKGKEAIVVSQGALDNLDREQLSAVVAHEFGHIAQGDIPVNMRLLIALGGLNAIDEVGKLLMVRSGGQLVAQPGAIVGAVIRCIGSIGVFFGRLIRSAFSRQREFLADATAVQFTRNPEWLASALTVIRDRHDDAAVHSVHAEELTHLCIQSGDKVKWMDKVFATHPPVQKRIDAIDPHYAVKVRAKERAVEKEQPGVYRAGRGATVTPISTDAGVALGASLVVSDAAEMMLTDSASCLAILHAVFVSEDRAKSADYYSAIAFAYNKIFSHQVKEIRETLSTELHNNQLALIDKATAQLRDSIKLENRQRLLKSLEKLLMVEGEFTLMNYATLQLIRRKLDAEFPVLEQKADAEQGVAQASQAKTFDTMGREFALLLSLIVESSGNTSSQYDDQFENALKCYTKEHHPRRSSDEPGIVKELEASFQTLYVQPRPIREAFVQHCLEIAQSDGHIAKDEKALLDLFAASLKCNSIAA